MNAEAFAILYATICRLSPPGAKRESWLQWAIQLEEEPVTAWTRSTRSVQASAFGTSQRRRQRHTPRRRLRQLPR
jgi:hypothetical protein